MARADYAGVTLANTHQHMKLRWDVPRVGPCGDAWARAHAQVVPSVPGRQSNEPVPWTSNRHHAPENIQTQQHLVRMSVQLALGAHRRKKSAQVSRQTCSSCAPKHAQISSRAANRHKMNLSNEVQTIDQTVTHIRPRSSHPQTEAWTLANHNDLFQIESERR